MAQDALERRNLHAEWTAFRKCTNKEFSRLDGPGDVGLCRRAAYLECRVADARIVLGGVAPIPWRAPKAEALLKGRRLDEATLQFAAALEGALRLAHNAYKLP